MINYVKGDATNPIGQGKKYLVHVCNDIGAWGAGFSGALSKKYPEPEDYFRTVFESKSEESFLGSTQFVWIKPGFIVINMIAQHKLFYHYKGTSKKPIRYDALRKCLAYVNELVSKEQTDTPASVHMPRIGCGLAGGKWEEVEKIINETMPDVQVYVYDLESS